MALLKIACDKTTLTTGSLWLLNKNINAYESITSDRLATEAIAGRKFKIINQANESHKFSKEGKLKIQLLEDGYICYVKFKDILGNIEKIKSWTPILLTKSQIKERLPKVLSWVQEASSVPNNYLWGGTVGPNFDCSGLIQAAFASQNIWLPRDAYQQEEFCTKVELNCNASQNIIPGDLIFFGDNKKCSHVGLYKGEDAYWHSSGINNGRDGIGIDYLKYRDNNAISSFYLTKLRGAGRIESCYQDK